MAVLTIEQVQSNICNYFKEKGLQENAYEPIRKKSGDSDILSIYVAGTRKSILGLRYGGTSVAEVRLVSRSSSSYQNGTITLAESKMSQITDTQLRQAAEGKLIHKVNGS